MGVRCVVFDFDGVLVDSNAVKRDAYFQIFADLDTGDLIEAALRSHGDGDRYEIIGAILQRLAEAGRVPASEAGPAAVARFAEAYNGICEEYAATCAEIGGASGALRELGGSLPLYVNSATPEEPLRRIIERRGWQPHFRAVLGRPRNKVENLRLVLEQEGCAAGELVMVGDGRHDLAAAYSVGCRFVGLRNRFNDFDTTALPMLDDLRALPDQLRAFGMGSS